jgi:hypothetical protein
MNTGAGYYRVEAKYAELLQHLGLTDAVSVFEHDDIKVWRSIRERENAVLDYVYKDHSGRLHVKRNKPGFSGVDDEVTGIQLLQKAGIATVPLVGAGQLHDGRGFLITDDLADYEDAEQRINAGHDFEPLLEPTAQLAARLHQAGLHHRDFYVCHVYVNPNDSTDLRLMDAGRVKPLPRFFRQRWINKDLAQFIYSIRNLDAGISARWLSAYASARGVALTFKAAVERKVKSIASHDVTLQQKNPERNVSIPR